MKTIQTAKNILICICIITTLQLILNYYKEIEKIKTQQIKTRQIVRKNKRRWDKFYMSVLSGYLSSKYWDLLDGSDKDGIMYQWSYRYHGFYNRLDCYKRLGDVKLS